MKIEQFRSRFAKAKSAKRTNWETLYRETMELFCPDRENFYKNISGEKKGRAIYTSAPTIALDKAANNIQSSLTPHQKKWMHLVPGRNIPEEARDQAKETLEQIREVFFSHLFASNFDLSAAEFYKDVLVGTAAMLVSSTDKEPLVFTTVPLHELYIQTGVLGTVDTVFREYKIKISQIKATWPDARLDADLERMGQDDPEKEITVIEGTVPARVTLYNRATDKDEERDGYKYCVAAQNTDGYLVERSLPISPWVVARWSVMSGEQYGRGPCIMALNDAKTLNEFIKLHIQNMAISVHPAYTIVDDGIVNISAIRIGPGAMIPVSANDGVYGASVAPLPRGGDFQAGQIEIHRLEASINDQLYTEPLGPITLPVKSATEISIRQQELAKRIGSAYGRLQHEFVNKVADISLYFLDANGFVDMNDFRVDGHTISVEPVSPLAMAQSQDDLTNVTRYVEFVLGTFGEMGMGLIKPAEVAAFVARELNIPQGLQMSKAELAQAASMAQQMIQQQGGMGGQEQAV